MTEHQTTAFAIGTKPPAVGFPSASDTIDLRSDTVTLPTQRMYDAMATARLGDDMRERDPTVVELERLAALKTGTEDALFVASGTMGNLVSVLAHTGRGSELLCDPHAHIARSELGGFAQVAGLFHRFYKAERGVPDVVDLETMLRAKPTAGALATGVVCVETSHNHAGGLVIPLDRLAEISALTRDRTIPLHIDGARLFNAAVALKVPASEIVRHADSVTFCLSKGLSAPVGSMVCGSAEFIGRARLFRRMIGGAMRQAGVIAAAGIVALDEMIDQLAEDHRRTAAIATGLSGIDRALIKLDEVETNILMVHVGHTGRSVTEWIAAMAAEGINLRGYGPNRLRLVIHRHVDDAAVDRIVGAVRLLCKAA
jgi:threonine aldolase